MIRLGLCSGACITRDISGVISAAVGARLDAVEWEANLHVGVGDLRGAEETMIATLTAGLTTASYASIYRAGSEDAGYKRFETLLATASVLQTPLLRVYARSGVEKLDDFASELRRLGDLTAKKGITLCLSFGRKTILDGYDHAKSIVEAVRHDFVRLAWEDLPGTRSAEATSALKDLGRLAGLVVARCADRGGRTLPVADEKDAWRERLGAFKLAEKDPKMGSFVFLGASRAEGKEGEASLSEDAKALRTIVEEIDRKP
jgi:3-dehydroshikimate dehydratase